MQHSEFDVQLLYSAIKDWLWVGANLANIVTSLLGHFEKFGINLQDLESRIIEIQKALFWRKTQILKGFFSNVFAKSNLSTDIGEKNILEIEISTIQESSYAEFIGNMDRIYELSNESNIALQKGRQSLSKIYNSFYVAIVLVLLNLVMGSAQEIWMTLSIILLIVQINEFRQLRIIRTRIYSFEICTDVVIGKGK